MYASELPDVAGPSITHQCLHSGRPDLRMGKANFFCHFVKEVIDQKQDVPLSFTQGREGDVKVIQAIEKILPEAPIPNVLTKVPISGRDDADVRPTKRHPSKRSVLAAFQKTEDLLLGGRIQISDLVRTASSAGYLS